MALRRIVQTDQTSSTVEGRARVVDHAATRSIERNRSIVRSADLIQTVQQLDTTADAAAMREIMQWIHDEYADRQVGQLAGLFGKCYLGSPYVDHRLDLTGGFIVEHFTRDQEPPPPFNAARPLARSDAYIFVEVYTDGTAIPIRPDGRPVI